MECLLQWQMIIGSGAGVPSPIDKSADVYWYDLGSYMCQEFADAGVTDMLNMPEWEGQNLGNNYDTRTEYGFGEINPLRGGSRESLGRLGAVLKANGMGFHSDLVLAHRDDANHPLKSITGDTLRYPKDNNCFVKKGVPKDNVAAPTEDFAYLFGQQVSYYSGYYGDGKGLNGRGYPKRNIIDAINHLFRAFDKQGARWDNVKSLDPSLIRDISNAKGAQQHLWGAAEYWSSDVWRLLGWLDSVQWKSSLFDFPLAFELRNAFNNAGNYNMANFQYVGLYQKAEFNTVTYCNSHDWQRSANRLIFNMATAYGMILGLPGLPCLYALDWIERFGGYGLDEKIKNSLYIRRFLGQGSLIWRYLSRNIIAWTRTGLNDAPGCLFAVNNSYKDGTEYIGVHSHFRNCWLHDYTGHQPDVWADDNGYSVIGVAKKKGFNIVAYAPHGWEGRKIPIHGRATKQRFEGAGDLRIRPATKDGAHVMRLWCAPEKEVQLDKPVGDGVRFELIDPDGGEIIPRGNWTGKTKQKGWHTLKSFAPTETPQRYIVDANYWAPRGL